MSPMPEAQPPPRKLTYEDYCAIPEDGLRHEIVDGVHFVSPAPLDLHQHLCVNLTLLLGNFLRTTKLGVLRQAPSDVLLEEHTIVQPDHYVVLAANLGRLQRNGCHGPPDLVVEVLSPGNTRHDLVRKFARYEAAGVPEYWIVDPAAERVEVYRREGEAGGFARPLVLSLRREDRLDTPLLPEFSVALAEVFDRGLLADHAGADEG